MTLELFIIICSLTILFSCVLFICHLTWLEDKMTLQTNLWFLLNPSSVVCAVDAVYKFDTCKRWHIWTYENRYTCCLDIDNPVTYRQTNYQLSSCVEAKFLKSLCTIRKRNWPEEQQTLGVERWKECADIGQNDWRRSTSSSFLTVVEACPAWC